MKFLYNFLPTTVMLSRLQIKSFSMCLSTEVKVDALSSVCSVIMCPRPSKTSVLSALERRAWVRKGNLFITRDPSFTV